MLYLLLLLVVLYLAWIKIENCVAFLSFDDKQNIYTKNRDWEEGGLCIIPIAYEVQTMLKWK